MAGDWIKIEHALPDKPECIRLAAQVGIDQDAVVGKLVRLWIWADQQTIDGDAAGVTSAFIDRLTNCPGFALALVSVGWLVDRNGRLKLPNFDRHNGQTAKRRALTKDRMKRSRDAAGVTQSSPEKRREEKIENNSGSGGRPPPEKPIGLLLDADDFLAVWNANQHTRKVHFASLIPGQRDLIDRLQNPAWVENFAQALAKLPLKAMRDPTISVEWFLKEDTVGKILNGSYDFEPTPGRGQPAAPQPPRRITRTPLE